jgi:hypothetical protein
VTHREESVVAQGTVSKSGFRVYAILRKTSLTGTCLVLEPRTLLSGPVHRPYRNNSIRVNVYCPCPRYEDTKEWMYSSTHSQPRRSMEVSSQLHASGVLSYGKCLRHPLGKPQSQYQRSAVKKRLLPLPGVDARFLGLTRT